MEKNKGQVVTEQQLGQIARRLFVSLDADNKLALTKDEAIEFICFMKENLYHSDFDPEKNKAEVDAMYEALPKTQFVIEVPNVHNPKYKEKRNQDRVLFEPLYEVILNEAK